MSVRSVLCIQAVSAISVDNTGTVVGWTAVGSVWLFFITGVLLLCLHKSRHFEFGSVVHLPLVLQFSRWTATLNYRTSDYFHAFWQALTVGVDPIEVIKADDDTAAEFRTVRIASTDFLQNNEEQFVVLCGVAIIALAGWKWMGSLTTFRLLAWTFLLTFTDIVASALLHFQTMEYSLASNICAITLFSLYMAGLGVLVVWTCRRQFSPFTDEFKAVDVVVVRMYYPSLLLLRTIVIGVLVADLSTDTQFAVVVVTEGVMLLYLILFTPYRKRVSSVVATLLHIGELVLAMVPILEETSDRAVSEVACGTAVLAMLLLSLMRLGLSSEPIQLGKEVEIHAERVDASVSVQLDDLTYIDVPKKKIEHLAYVDESKILSHRTVVKVEKPTAVQLNKPKRTPDARDSSAQKYLASSSSKPNLS